MPVTADVMLSRRPAGRIRPQLHRLRRVLHEMGDPQQHFRSVLVVGTNGKGSTAAALEAILRSHGLATGLFTSPHLVRVEERIRIGGREVAAGALARILDALDHHHDLTFFETVTAAAFVAFAEAGVETAVLEAGMGGSWDATRLADSAIAGLTNVGSDHAGWLGRERRDRARDKGRALQAAERAVIGAGVAAADLAAIDAPHAIPAPALVCCEAAAPGSVRVAWGSTEVVAEVPLPGAHQLANVQLAVALALQAVDAGWLPGLGPARVISALATLRWPGRLSTHAIGRRRVVVDCAHNLEAAHALVAHLRSLDRRFNLVFSCLDDKPVEEMATILRPAVGEVAICELDDDRAMPLARLASAWPDARPGSNPVACLDLVDDPVLVAGSIRLVGDLLSRGGVEP